MILRHWYSVCSHSRGLASVTAGRLAASRLPPALPRLSSRTLASGLADQLNASVRWLAAQDSDPRREAAPDWCRPWRTRCAAGPP